MKIILNSLDTVFKIATLDTTSGKVRIFLRFLRPDLSSDSASGICSKARGKLICFYRVDERLFLKVDDRTVEFQDDDSVFLKYVTGREYEFAVLRNKQKIFSCGYQKPEIYPPIGLFGEEEEDFDIFLRVCNIISDPEGKKHFFSHRNQLIV